MRVNETIAAAYTPCILDVFIPHLLALIKEENKPRAIAEIEKTSNQNRYQDIKNQLLALCQ